MRKKKPLGMNAPAVIFDGDDTLWELQPLYNRAISEFASMLSIQCDTTPENVRRFLERAERANLPRMGFGPKRFEASLKWVYGRLCADARNRQHDSLRKI